MELIQHANFWVPCGDSDAVHLGQCPDPVCFNVRYLCVSHEFLKGLSHVPWALLSLSEHGLTEFNWYCFSLSNYYLVSAFEKYVQYGIFFSHRKSNSALLNFLPDSFFPTSPSSFLEKSARVALALQCKLNVLNRPVYCS